MKGSLNLRDNVNSLILLASPFVAWWMWLRFKSHRAGSWPTAPGRIESGEVSVVRGKGGKSATAILRYSYQASGEYYAGNHKEHFNDEQKAWDYVDAAKGRAVQVRHHPKRPEKSMLRAEDQTGL